MEDVPVLVLAELVFARTILFGESEDGAAAQQPLDDIAPRVKVHPAFRQHLGRDALGYAVATACAAGLLNPAPRMDARIPGNRRDATSPH